MAAGGVAGMLTARVYGLYNCLSVRTVVWTDGSRSASGR